MTLRNALTIDVEDYFQVNAFADRVRLEQWDGFPLRVEQSTVKVLDLLDRFGLKGTFFVLGWVAQRLPRLAPEIMRRGHEIACHGFAHQLVYQIGPAAFREDIRRAKGLLEEQCGVEVRGYRAPSYSITGKSLWALEILVEEGFGFDSSIFPVLHDTYGIPGARRFPHTLETAAGKLLEFPLSTFPLKLPLKRVDLPVAGGGYLRFLPAPVVSRALRSINEREGEPAVLYFHPWELDPEQPRLQGRFRSRLRHYLNLEKTQAKLEHLFERLPFCPMGEVLGLAGTPEAPSAHA